MGTGIKKSFRFEIATIKVKLFDLVKLQILLEELIEEAEADIIDPYDQEWQGCKNKTRKHIESLIELLKI